MRGGKPTPPSEKAKRGTLQPIRDADRWELPASEDPPRMPETLSVGAQVVWEEVLSRVVKAGACELDSTALETLCELVSATRKAWESGAAPPAAHLAEKRRLEESFGLLGPKSRVGRMQKGKNATGPFTKRRP